MGFFKEVDAASGPRCDWRRALDGDDGDVADVAWINRTRVIDQLNSLFSQLDRYT